MKLAAGTPVLVSGGSLSHGSKSGVVEEDYDGGNTVLVRLAGKAKPRSISSSRVRPAEPVQRATKLPNKRIRVVRHTTAVKLRPVPRAAKPARDEGYLAFVRSKACKHCHAPPPSDPHHWARRGCCGGMSQKPDDYRTVPLCRRCHDSVQERKGFPQIGEVPGCNPAMAKALMLAWQVDLLVEWLVSGGRPQ